jgi:two-component sensor histidine kinase
VAKTRHAVAVAEGGSLDVSCHADDGDVVMVWAERGGPPVVAPTGPPGFGSRLVAQNISGQRGGSIAFDWPTEGVVATLRMSKTRLAT